MCLAYPMKVLERTGPTLGICDNKGVATRVDMSFVPDAGIGDWVTVHMGIARELMTEADAQQLLDALTALDMVREGATEVDHLFADLVGREPQRPPQSSSD